MHAAAAAFAGHTDAKRGCPRCPSIDKNDCSTPLMKLTALLCIHLCSSSTAKKGSSRDKFWRRQQQHRGRRTPAPTRAPTPVGPTQVPTTAAPAAAPDRRGAVRARGGMLAQRVTTTPDRRQAVRLRAGVLAKRAAAAPLPVLSATKCVVALLVVSETDLMAVVDRRLQQTGAAIIHGSP